jgi:ectoine hydroxylase-related dioxygenase (phytanoyl-CoA dioxygenase family)
MRWAFQTGRSHSVQTIGYHAARSNLANQVNRMAALFSMIRCDAFVHRLDTLKQSDQEFSFRTVMSVAGVARVDQ